MDTDAETDSAGLARLTKDTCYDLLRTVPVGRIVFTEGALPAIQPVNFVLDGPRVVIRIGAGSKLAAATRSAIVAFEADQFDEELRSGWSVVLIGRAQAVTDAAERDRLADLPLTPFAPGTRPHYVTIDPEIVRGRRIIP